jgi:hypothetical protein
MGAPRAIIAGVSPAFLWLAEPLLNVDHHVMHAFFTAQRSFPGQEVSKTASKGA